MVDARNDAGEETSEVSMVCEFSAYLECCFRQGNGSAAPVLVGEKFNGVTGNTGLEYPSPILNGRWVWSDSLELHRQ